VSPPSEHLDVLVVGAGLSGIGAAYHLLARRPHATFAILEAREALGGTWDLFRYPGIRSDSDMHTLGYRFHPWRGDRAIADGPSILAYLGETARHYGIDRKIRFGHRVERAWWSSDAARWTVEIRRADTSELVRLTCGFLFMCSGYYDYAAGHTPPFEGLPRYRGRVVHPQAWTADVDYDGKRVVVIGSGATAVTLVPELAKRAAHVTMLQRSPSYVLSLASEDRASRWLSRRLPTGVAYGVTRWKNVAASLALYELSRRYPGPMKRLLIGGVQRGLGRDFDVATHFTPRYAPWDQRLCVVPDGDLFVALTSARAEVVTDHVASFTESGLALRSGRTLDADLVVTATGLALKLLGGVALFVDGAPVELGKTTAYRGAMFTGVPNLAVSLGYTNASWTLKSDLVSEYVCRLLGEMERRGYRACTPERSDDEARGEPLIDLSSTYVTRALADLPRQGDKAPFRLRQNYLLDLLAFRYGALHDGALRFAR
jgi:cation diffusion facilitator CzcD-associated flavoprotein CzcO